jgi:glycine oxidase
MTKTAGIAGAGLVGRLLGVELARTGWHVTLFDADTREAQQSCAYTGAGMLAPYCELETADELICRLGLESLSAWPRILGALDRPVPFERAGSLVVAHRADETELQRLQRRVARQIETDEPMVPVDGADIAGLEPDLAGRFEKGLYFPTEGHIDSRALLQALEETLLHAGTAWHPSSRVSALTNARIHTDSGESAFDCVFDCRGLGARDAFPSLRGVRGELIYLRAPDVRLHRPVRLMHPRYPLYIVPRKDHLFVVGATSIESDDAGAITVRSALELLSAAYAVHPGFAEGRIVETCVNRRPAFPDHRPRVLCEPGLVRVNGLYRHGYLIAPALVQRVLEYVNEGTVAGGDAAFVEAAPHAGSG